ncbi:DUF1800 domain-containing protein [Hymenobacter sp. BT664]|uniref:DUF1800 domain-containing protein n=1 Tax=Hymenobacter montanus TaxID=2771359 RepID=A0A927BGK8_9BACT|nr:DUF1800 domain-containing protein [Hymenobacter montanus]MBD2769622.1 DUF1800 domain-containing protein [Hymenobacter montanus]
MNRRTFLRKPAAPVAALLEQPATGSDQPPGKGETVSKFANKDLPATPRSLAGLAPYTGPWGSQQAAHLLRRATFGPTRAEINTAAGQSLTQVLDRILTVPSAPPPPVNGFSDAEIPLGSEWVSMSFDSTGVEYYLRESLRSWWIGQMVQSTTTVEKMTLFWHNHFVTEFEEVFITRPCYRHWSLLRQHALGNFKQLAKDVTIEPAMLSYLSGNYNTADAPNENYGRELLELFTIGKGPIIGPGNYTTYTEADVQAAARVLTGWQYSEEDFSSFFTDSRHDPSTKHFSSAFGNRTIANQGDQEYKALIDLIFDRPETAAFLVRKLYRWFVYYVIDATTEANVIQPLATQFKNNGYDVAPILRTLLGSEHFFDMVNMGCMIKSPVDFVVGTVRQLAVALPPESNIEGLYYSWDWMSESTDRMQQLLGDPPNVAGWAAYWQTPQYYEMWINATTLLERSRYTQALIRQDGYTFSYPTGRHTLRIDVIAFVRSLPAATASDCNLMIAELNQLLLPLPLTASQLAALKTELIGTLPDFEWTVEWQAFLAAPNDMTIRNALETKLRALVRQIINMAEYHLS